MALCLTESDVLKSCLQVTYNYYILQHTSAFPVAIERLQMNTSIHPRLQKKYYFYMHFYPSLLVPVEIQFCATSGYETAVLPFAMF